jgi:hypothetical protein
MTSVSSSINVNSRAASKFAVAVYDNEAESDDELNFKKNDLVQILQADYMGMEGWCLCKLVKTSSVGLAAENRLKPIHDEKILAKLAARSIGANAATQSHQHTHYHNHHQHPHSKFSSKTNSIISTSSSNSSINSSSASLYSPVSTASSSMSSLERQKEIQQQQQQSNDEVTTVSENLAKLGLESDESKPKIPLIPAKLTDSKQPLSMMRCSQSRPPPSADSTSIKQNSDKSNKNNTNQSDDDDDDDDYDIPENNKSVVDLTAVASSTTSDSKIPTSTTVRNEPSVMKATSAAPPASINSRKSLSSTIDSGISTSSLISLNSSNNNLAAYDTCSKSDSMLIDETMGSSAQDKTAASIAEFEAEFRHKLEALRALVNAHAVKISDGHALTVKESTFLVKFLTNFINFNLKRFKNEHACFHPSLGVFNKFKSVYAGVREFHAFCEKHLLLLSSCGDSKQRNNDSGECSMSLQLKFNCIVELVGSLQKLIADNKLFSYHSLTSIEVFRQEQELEARNRQQSKNCSDDEDLDEVNAARSEHTAAESNNSSNYDNYNYVAYDNVNNRDEELDQANNEYSDYCQIDEANDSNQNSNDEEEVSSEGTSSSDDTAAEIISKSVVEDRTLTKQEAAAINRLPRLLDTVDSGGHYASVEPSRQLLSPPDAMLLKFYLKHVDENLDEMNAMYAALLRGNFFDTLSRDKFAVANRFGLHAHKLLFICDTLERNLSCEWLKSSLFKVSSLLSESLKVYALRLKVMSEETTTVKDNDRELELIADCMSELYRTSNQLRQLVVKNHVANC